MFLQALRLLLHLLQLLLAILTSEGVVRPHGFVSKWEFHKTVLLVRNWKAKVFPKVGDYSSCF